MAIATRPVVSFPLALIASAHRPTDPPAPPQGGDAPWFHSNPVFIEVDAAIAPRRSREEWMAISPASGSCR